MGLLDFIKKIISTQSEQSLPQTLHDKQSSTQKKLTYAEKELIMVNRVTTEDMRKITSIPYNWNTAVRKFIVPNGHPFAYIDLIGSNIDIAKNELEKMNALIAASSKLSPSITKRISIPVDKIVFTPQKHHGHTRLMCTPHTFTGKPAKYPVSLSFMTDLSNNNISTHGNLFYGQDGSVQKAEVFCWRNSGGHFYYFNTVDGILTLEKFERDGEIIYKSPHILAAEAMRRQEEKDFEWVQQNIPDKCPKTISGYRRIKKLNTKNYQELKALAIESGRKI